MRHFILSITFFTLLGIINKATTGPDKGSGNPGKNISENTLNIKKQNLYIIQRNKNRNTVYYDLNILPNGEVYGAKPIDCYWKMYEKNGIREELTTFEKLTAYGYDVVKSSKGDYLIKMNSLKNRVCQLYKDKSGVYSCLTLIAGKKSNLKRIYVFTIEGYISTTVKYIELFGKDVITGADTYEKVINN